MLKLNSGSRTEALWAHPRLPQSYLHLYVHLVPAALRDCAVHWFLHQWDGHSLEGFSTQVPHVIPTHTHTDFSHLVRLVNICGVSSSPLVQDLQAQVQQLPLAVSLLLIISRMVMVQLKSFLSLSIFSYEASSFLRFWNTSTIEQDNISAAPVWVWTRGR